MMAIMARSRQSFDIGFHPHAPAVPDSRISAAISIKPPFSHNAWLGFMTVGSLPSGSLNDMFVDHIDFVGSLLRG